MNAVGGMSLFQHLSILDVMLLLGGLDQKRNLVMMNFMLFRAGILKFLRTFTMTSKK